MQKLIDRFEKLIWECNPNASYVDDLSIDYLTEGFANEAKKIAIAFSYYTIEEFKVFWKNPVKELTYETMWNKFIEEYYG